ncbi:ceramide kinase-like protein [Hippocampus comes]|uniref:ceramide kinase-like protein n=1 Tax=Hippocampus comes TaxID=109280 RepID=UPI00094E3E59|nr:PREDICTED: ceramide kinase-like protein [Hippocampus comes]
MSTREEDREEKEQKTEEEKLSGSKKRNKKKKEEEREKAEEEYKPEVERSERVLLRGIFKVGKRSHDVLLTATRLTWSPILPESPAGEACTSPPGVLMLRDVLAVKVKRRRAVGQRSGGPVLGVALFYCKRRGRRLEEDTLHLHNASSEHTHTWYNSLKEVLAGLSGRPRRIKVFINPSSHKKEAVHVYREHVAPLFKMADVHTDITVTERTGHALSVMKELKLDDFDGKLVVGTAADTPRAEERRRRSASVRAAFDLAVGFRGLRAASGVSHTGRVVFSGHVQRVDMCSLRSPGGPPRFGFCAMFGFGGRSLARAEKKRWMPPARRRDYALLKTLARLRPEDCRLSFLTSRANDRDRDAHQDGDSEGTESWSSAEGLFLSVGVMAIPCLSPHAPRGLAPDTK